MFGSWYFGKEEYEKYGQMISEKLAGHIISKRISDSKNPDGLEHTAKLLHIDMWDLLSALEGMCHNGLAEEINDSEYMILWRK